MHGLLRRLSFVFSAGAVGGLVNSVAAWALGAAGVTAALGVTIAPQLTPPWLYQRLVWGGIWGALFLVPLLGRRLVLKGVMLSLGPTIVQLLVVFPFQAQKGVLGLQLGILTPLVVILLNAVWGLAAVAWLALVEGPVSAPTAAVDPRSNPM